MFSTPTQRDTKKTTTSSPVDIIQKSQELSDAWLSKDLEERIAIIKNKDEEQEAINNDSK